MQELVREYLSNVKSRRKRRRRITITIAVFAVLVVGSVVWSLARMGIAMTGDPKCGVEEHTHSDACYTDTLVCGMEESAGHTHSDACYQTESTLVCGMEESEEHVHDESCYATSQTLICGQEESAGHTHTDACHDKALSCGKAEHTHTEDCFIDSGADVEDASVWDAQYAGVEWKDAWGEDLAAAAQMQVGYKESTKNYIVAEDGSHKGYTRYGQFVGDAYADWDAPFVNFCLHYAGLEASNMFPNEKVTAQWYDTFVKANEENQKYLTAPAGYEPKPGDIIFFHKEGEETDTQMGIVSSYDKEKNEIKVIEGNSGNEVKENKYDIGDQHISSYMMVTEMEKVYKPSDAGEGSAGENTEAPEDTSQIFTTEENTEETWAYENSYEDDTIVIHVRAGEGVVPEGAELSVTPIEQKEVTSDMTEEEAAEAEKVNEQYELTNQKLQEESEKKQETLEGFLAYDICFIVDGEEVEPSGDVKVTMDFKEATKPEGVSENAVVAVNHLKEDENAADGIVVEDLTAKADTTIATAEADASVEKVELVAESFSTFTITWVAGGLNLEEGKLNVEYVDERGVELASKETDKAIVIQPNTRTDLLGGSLGLEKSQIVKGADIYLPQEVKVFESSTQSHTVTKVEYKMEIDMYGNYNRYFVFYNSDENEVYEVYRYNVQEQKDNFDPDKKIQIVYKKSDSKIPGIVIQDNGNGTIQVTLGMDEETGKEISQLIDDAKKEGKPVKFTWQKNINNTSFEDVGPKKWGDVSNISDEGDVLNIAIDEGGLTSSQQDVKYKVILTIGEGDEKKIFTSTDFSVPYFGKLQNGGFEAVKPEQNVQQGRGMYAQFKVSEWEEKARALGTFFGWKTTAGDDRIEIAEADMSRSLHSEYSQPNGTFYAAEGSRFAELNATEVGTLYQDVLTIGGTPLNYYFSHRARTNTRWDEEQRDWANSMYVVIIPTSVAENGIKPEHRTGSMEGAIDTQAEVLCLINHKDEYENVLVDKYEAYNKQWTGNGGVYIPQSYLTRFFFVSDENSKASLGNFIDNVWLDQDPPPANPGTFSVWIKKTAIGLNEKEQETLKESLTFKVRITDQNGQDITEALLGAENAKGIKIPDARWEKGTNNTLVGGYVFNDIPINAYLDTYTVSVVEERDGVEISGYELNDSLEVKGGNVSTDKKSTVVAEKDSAYFEFTNTYTPNNVDWNKKKNLTVQKEWEDYENSYKTRPEDLIIELSAKVSVGENQYEDLDLEDLNVSPTEKIITEKDGWSWVWENLPVYHEKQTIIWSVKEKNVPAFYSIKDNDNPVQTSEASGLSEDSNEPVAERDEKHLITNVLQNEAMKNWRMVKQSSTDEIKKLAGAEFELRKVLVPTQYETVATGISKDDGDIEWVLTKEFSDTLPENDRSWDVYKEKLNGNYKIFETKAPTGYSRNETGWEVEFINGIPNITKDYKDISKDIEKSGDAINGIIFYIGNTALYALPDSGGSGIYLYMFSGILLMAVAVLITYKNKKRRKGVLRS